LQCVAVCCSVLQCVAVCCSVPQCVAVCCSVLQCVALCCRVLQCVAGCCSVLQCTAVCCSVLHCAAVCFSVLQSVAECCIVSQYVAVCRSVLQFVAVCCSVLQCVAVCCSVSSYSTMEAGYLEAGLPLRKTQLGKIEQEVDSFLLTLASRQVFHRALMNWSCNTCTCVMPHMWMSHVTHMDKSRHTYDMHTHTHTHTHTRTRTHTHTFSLTHASQQVFHWALIHTWRHKCTWIAKEPYKRDDILQKSPIILRSLLIVATP